MLTVLSTAAALLHSSPVTSPPSPCLAHPPSAPDLLQGPPAWHPAPEQLKAAAAAAATAAAARGVSLPKLAIMEAVKDPAIASHLVGFCTRQQVGGAVAL